MPNGGSGTVDSDFPSLLPLGMHELSLTELRRLCVDNFSLSSTRNTIMQGLEQIVDTLNSQAIEGKLWVDGSFVTEKINPNDSDVVLFIQGPFYDNATIQQRQIVDWFGQDLKASHCCDIYVSYEWPVGHPLYWVGEYWRAYWLRQWGFGRDETIGPAKGIAVISL
jgi:hypothetical protein